MSLLSLVHVVAIGNAVKPVDVVSPVNSEWTPAMRTRNFNLDTVLNEWKFVFSVAGWSISICPTEMHPSATVRSLITKHMPGQPVTKSPTTAQSIEELSDVEVIRRLLHYANDEKCYITETRTNLKIRAYLSDLMESDSANFLDAQHIQKVFEAARWGGRYQARSNKDSNEASAVSVPTRQAHSIEDHSQAPPPQLHEHTDDGQRKVAATDVAELRKLQAQLKPRTEAFLSRMSADFDEYRRQGLSKEQAIRKSSADSIQRRRVLDELSGNAGRLLLGKRLPRELDPRYPGADEELEGSYFQCIEENQPVEYENWLSSAAVLLERLATQRELALSSDIIGNIIGNAPLSEVCASTTAVDEVNRSLLRVEAEAGRLEFRARVVVPHPNANGLWCWRELKILGIRDWQSFQRICQSASSWSLSELDGLRPPDHIKEPIRVRLIVDGESSFRLDVVLLKEGKETDISKLKPLRLGALWRLETEAESDETRKSRTILQLVVPLAAACPPIGSLVRLFDTDEFKPKLRLTSDEVILFKNQWMPDLKRMGVMVETPSDSSPKASIPISDFKTKPMIVSLRPRPRRELDVNDIACPAPVSVLDGDTGQINVGQQEKNYKRDALTLLVPDAGSARARAREFIKQFAIRKLRTRDGVREYELTAVPRGTLAPPGCRLIRAVIPPKRRPKRTDLVDGNPKDVPPVNGDRSHDLMRWLSSKRKVELPQELVDHNTLTSPMPWSLLLDRAAQEGLLEFRALVRVPNGESPTELQWKELRIKGSTGCSSFQELCFTAKSVDLNDIPAEDHDEEWRKFTLDMSLSVRLETQPGNTEFPFRIKVTCVLEGDEREISEMPEVQGAAFWSLRESHLHKMTRKVAIQQRLVPLAAACPPIGSLIRLFAEDPFEPKLELTLDQIPLFLKEWAPALRQIGIEVILPEPLDSLPIQDAGRIAKRGERGDSDTSIKKPLISELKPQSNVFDERSQELSLPPQLIEHSDQDCSVAVRIGIDELPAESMAQKASQFVDVPTTGINDQRQVPSTAHASKQYISIDDIYSIWDSICLLMLSRGTRELDYRCASDECSKSTFRWHEKGNPISYKNQDSQEAKLLQCLATQGYLKITSDMIGVSSLREICTSQESLRELNRKLLQVEEEAGRLEYRALVRMPHPDGNGLLCWRELVMQGIKDCSSFSAMCFSSQHFQFNELKPQDSFGLPEPKNFQHPLLIRLRKKGLTGFQLAIEMIKDGKEYDVATLRTLQGASMWSLKPRPESKELKHSRAILQRIVPIAAICPPIGSLIRRFDDEEFVPNLDLSRDDVDSFLTKWVPKLTQFGIRVEIPKPGKRTTSSVNAATDSTNPRAAIDVTPLPVPYEGRAQGREGRDFDNWEIRRHNSREEFLISRLLEGKQFVFASGSVVADEIARDPTKARNPEWRVYCHEEILKANAASSQLGFRALVRVGRTHGEQKAVWKELRLNGVSQYSSFQALMHSAQNSDFLKLAGKDLEEDRREFEEKDVLLKVGLEQTAYGIECRFRLSVQVWIGEQDRSEFDLRERGGVFLWALKGDDSDQWDWITKRAILHRLIAAAAVCPPICTLIRLFNTDPFEPQLDLSVDEAFCFLTEWAPKLEEEVGAIVLLPPELDPKKKKQVSVIPQRSEDSSGHLSWDKLHFNAQAYLNDHPLTPAEIELLVKDKRHFIELHGKYHFFKTEQAEKYKEKLELLLKCQSGEITAQEWFLSNWRLKNEQPDEDEVDAANADADDERTRARFQAALVELHGSDAELKVVSKPEDFKGDLWPIQSEGLSWLVSRSRLFSGACLADDMGLGKTAQAIAWILHNRSLGERRPVLLICPVSMLKTWIEAAREKFAALKVKVHHGAEKDDKHLFRVRAQKADLVLTTYSLVERESDILIDHEQPWSAVILDEGQNIKNPNSNKAKAVKRIPADFRLVLSGTPIENRVLDLWSIFDFLIPGFLGTRQQFERKYAKGIRPHAGAAQKDQLRRDVAPFYLRRVFAKVYPDLRKEEHDVICKLTPEQAALYQAHYREAQRRILSETDKARQHSAVLESLIALKLICNHASLHRAEQNPELLTADGQSRSGKLDQLKEILLGVIERHEHALIFTQYATKMAKIFDEFLRLLITDKHSSPLFFDGKLSISERKKVREQFQSDDEYKHPFMVVSLQAGGAGLDFTRANNVIHFDHWWNPAVERQATARAHRFGQDLNKTVNVYRLLCDKTIEIQIDRIQKDKQKLAQEVTPPSLTWKEKADLFRPDAEDATI